MRGHGLVLMSPPLPHYVLRVDQDVLWTRDEAIGNEPNHGGDRHPDRVPVELGGSRKAMQMALT